jgi:hypothetical protein
MKNIKILFIILTAALFFTACEKDETSDLWNLSGEVLIQDALTPEITSPLEGVNVYLLNAPFTIDSITNWFTTSDILDSTKTNMNGLYEFKQLQAGDYAVLPADTTERYRFEWSENSDGILLSTANTKTNYKIDFTTPEPIAENSGGKFEFNINNQNFCGITDSGTLTGKRIAIYRKTRSWGLQWNGWKSKLGWGNWNWKWIANKDYMSVEKYKSFYQLWKQVEISVDKNDDSLSKQYKDEFQIRFSTGGVYENFNSSGIKLKGSFDLKHTIELSGETLKNTNEFDVDWIDDKVTILE